MYFSPFMLCILHPSIMASECEEGREKKMSISYFYLKKINKDSRPYVCFGNYRNNTQVYPQTSLGATIRKYLDGPQPQLMKLSIYAYSYIRLECILNSATWKEPSHFICQVFVITLIKQFAWLRTNNL